LAEKLGAVHEVAVRATSRRKVDVVEGLVQQGAKIEDTVKLGRNVGGLVGRIRSGVSAHVDEIRERIGELPLVDKRSLAVALAVAAAKERTPENPKKSIPFVASRVGVPGSPRSWDELVRGLSSILEDRSRLDDILAKLLSLLEELRQAATDVERYVGFFERELSKIVMVPVEAGAAPSHGSEKVAARCSICRAEVAKGEELSFKRYVEAMKQVVRGALRQEVFHPDVQGTLRGPAAKRAIEDVRKLPVCPGCVLEAKVMPEFGITGASWLAVLSYGPVAPYLLLKAVAQAVRGEDVKVLADYLSARIVATQEDNLSLSKRLTRNFAAAWYVFGGSLAIVRDPLKAPNSLDRVLYTEKTAPIFEAVDSMIMERLKSAAASGGYVKERIYRLRFEAYRILQLYIESLEERPVRGELKSRPVLRLALLPPALSSIAFYTKYKLDRMRR
jgi:hypothetical protein